MSGHLLILGCGVVGTLVGQRMTALGWTVVGTRRQPWQRDTTDPQPGFPVVATGELPSLAASPRAVLIAANPGLRRGRDHGLQALVQAAAGRFPSSRVVLISTTSLYADAGGAGVDETGAIGLDSASRALRAIEVAAEGHSDLLVLRATALIGPTRTFAQGRIATALRTGSPLVIHGDLERPFSYLHDDDLAEVASAALGGALGTGCLNLAHPERLTVRGYYERLAGQALTLTSDGAAAPRRWIDARRFAAAWTAPLRRLENHSAPA